MLPFTIDFTSDAPDAAEIVVEVTRQQPWNEAVEVEAADSENIPPPTSSGVVAGLAQTQCYCSTMEGTGLKLVECLDTVEQGIIRHAVN